MWRLMRALLVLAAILAVAFVAYAYLGPTLFADDFAPPLREVVEPVELGLE